jgi:hypothetical protein
MKGDRKQRTLKLRENLKNLGILRKKGKHEKGEHNLSSTRTVHISNIRPSPSLFSDNSPNNWLPAGVSGTGQYDIRKIYMKKIAGENHSYPPWRKKVVGWKASAYHMSSSSATHWALATTR